MTSPESEHDLQEAPISGFLLTLLRPVFDEECFDEHGDPFLVGHQTIYFGPYPTEHGAEVAGDQYLLGVAGLHCGDADCTMEHAFLPKVVPMHPPTSLEDFIASEREAWDASNDDEEQTG